MLNKAGANGHSEDGENEGEQENGERVEKL